MQISPQELNPFASRASALSLPKLTSDRISEVLTQVNDVRSKFNREPIRADQPIVHIVLGKSVFFDTQEGYRGPKDDLDAWSDFMAKNPYKKLPQGRLYSFGRRLLDINQLSPDPRKHPLIQVDFATEISKKSFPRVYHSMIQHGLAQYMDQGLLTTTFFNYGTDPDANREAIVETVLQSNAHFYFSNKKTFAEAVLNAGKSLGIGAAYMMPAPVKRLYDPTQRGIVIEDLDGVEFTDGAEKVFQDSYQRGIDEAKKQGLSGEDLEEHAYQYAVTHYNQYLFENRFNPEGDGPCSEFLSRLAVLNSFWETPENRNNSPFDLRTCSARGHIASLQAILGFEGKTGELPHRMTFLSGRSKNRYLVKADLYLEDSKSHLERTEAMNPSERPQGLALVPYGVKNSSLGKTLESAPKS